MEWTRAVGAAVCAALGAAVDAVPTWVLIVALLVVVGGPEVRKLIALVDNIAWRWSGRADGAKPAATEGGAPNGDGHQMEKGPSQGNVHPVQKGAADET